MANKLPKLRNIIMTEFLLAACADDIPYQETDLVLGFVEALQDGIKFSMSFQEKQQGYCVSVTLPATSPEKEKECATFWGGSIHTALQKAWAVTFLFNGHKDGWDKAEARVDKAQANAANEFKEFIHSRLK